MIFRKKAILRNVKEWNELRGKTLGGDNFPDAPGSGHFPLMAMEAVFQHGHKDNEVGNARETFTDHGDKAYIVLEAADIVELHSLYEQANMYNKENK